MTHVGYVRRPAFSLSIYTQCRAAHLSFHPFLSAVLVLPLFLCGFDDIPPSCLFWGRRQLLFFLFFFFPLTGSVQTRFPPYVPHHLPRSYFFLLFNREGLFRLSLFLLHLS